MPAPIPVVLFVTSLAVGGTERQLVRLVQVLPKDRFTPHVVTLVSGGLLEQQVQDAGAELHCLDYRPMRTDDGRLLPGNVFKNLGVTSCLARILKSTNAQILHTHLPVCNILGWVAAKQAGLSRTLCTKVALGNYRDNRPMLARAENFVDPRFTLVHCKSQGIAADVQRREPVAAEKIRVVYNGIDVDAFAAVRDRNAVRGELGVADDDILVLTVANLIPYKGHVDILNAAKLLLQRPDAARTVFVFAGRDDGIQTSLALLAEQLAVSHRVRFVGPVEDVASLMHHCDVLLSASHEEGFSNVLLEGMAARLPIVATDVGGNGEAIVHDETGLLIPARNPQAMSDALYQLVTSAEQRQSMGQAGRGRVERNFSQDAMRDGMVTIYDELLSK